MERILKTLCILVLAFSFAVTVGPAAGPGVYAGGGTNYKVTVKNDIQFRAKVKLMVDKVTYVDSAGEQYVQPGDTYTFEAGEWCPVELRATIMWKDDDSILWAENIEHQFQGGLPDCADSSWRIVKGDGETKFRFVKD